MGEWGNGGMGEWGNRGMGEWRVSRLGIDFEAFVNAARDFCCLLAGLIRVVEIPRFAMTSAWDSNRMARRNGSYADGRRQRGISVKN